MKNILVALGLTAAILAVIFGIFYLRKPTEEALPGPELVTPSIETESEIDPATPEPVSDAPVSDPLPPEPPKDLDGADEHLRERFVEADPGLRDILERDHLVAKIATATDLIYRKKNPMSQLPFLLRRDRLIAERDGDRLRLSSRNYRRYEKSVALFEGLDSEGAVAAYSFLKPLFEGAFNQLGMGERDWDTTLQSAFEYLISIEVPRTRPELEGVGKVFVFVDPALEDLPPTHKAFIRMGPENARRIQDKVRDLKKILDLR